MNSTSNALKQKGRFGETGGGRIRDVVSGKSENSVLVPKTWRKIYKDGM